MTSLIDFTTLDTASCSHPEHCDRGSNLSGSLGGRRRIAINCLQDGPSLFITPVSVPLSHIPQAQCCRVHFKLRYQLCFCQLVEKQPAQLAKKAALLFRMADCSPMPFINRRQLSFFTGTCVILEGWSSIRHNDYCRVLQNKKPTMIVEVSEAKSSLGLARINSLEQCRVLDRLAFQESCDEVVMPQTDFQNLEPLFTRVHAAP